jgi:hypothetical protein
VTPSGAVSLDQAATIKSDQRLSDQHIFLIMGVIAVLAAAGAFWATSSINPLRGDSAEYLYFDRSRSVGYPTFLAIVRLMTGRVGLAVPIQMILLAASLLALGLSFYRLTRRPIWSVIFMVALVAQAGMWFSAAFLMTEALSSALVALWCAQLLRMTRTSSLLGAAWMTAVAAAGTMVRPPLIVLFVASATFMFTALPTRDRRRMLAMTAAGLIVAWSATPIAQLLVHGSAQTTSPFARGVLQHTLYCDVGPAPLDRDAALVEQVSAPVRRYIDFAPGDVQEQLRREYSTPLRFGLIIPALGREHQVDTRSALDPYLAPIARQRVAANPGCYARSVLGEYARMATFDTDPTAEDGSRVASFVGDHPPLDLPQLPVLAGDERAARRAAAEVGTAPAGLNPPRYHLNVVAKVPLAALLPFRLLFGAAALIGGVAMFALIMRRKIVGARGPELAAAAAMGIAFHGLLVITAIVEIGFFRYLVPLWPIVCTLIALAILAVSAKRSSEVRHEP